MILFLNNLCHLVFMQMARSEEKDDHNDNGLDSWWTKDSNEVTLSDVWSWSKRGMFTGTRLSINTTRAIKLLELANLGERKEKKKKKKRRGKKKPHIHQGWF